MCCQAPLRLCVEFTAPKILMRLEKRFYTSSKHQKPHFQRKCRFFFPGKSQCRKVQKKTLQVRKTRQKKLKVKGVGIL